MLKLDDKPDESFALFYENGKIRIDHSPSASGDRLHAPPARWALQALVAQELRGLRLALQPTVSLFVPVLALEEVLG